MREGGIEIVAYECPNCGRWFMPDPDDKPITCWRCGHVLEYGTEEGGE